jgi:biotin operon repressor
LFNGQKAAILDLLLKNRGRWVPAYSLSAVALQYNARVKELRDAGYVIENQTTHHGRQVHGSFRLVACPGEVLD